jgi:hypothetical protein
LIDFVSAPRASGAALAALPDSSISGKRVAREPLQGKLIKIGAKVVSHGRYIAFQMAESRHSEKLVRRYPAAHRGVATAASILGTTQE